MSWDFSDQALWKKIDGQKQKEYIKEYLLISSKLDASDVQDSSAFRNIMMARSFAAILIDEKGNFLTREIPKLIEELKNAIHSLIPARGADSVRNAHVLKGLILLLEDREAQRILMGISRPLDNPAAETLIRDTLLLLPTTPITDALARRASVAALLTYLRQSVGSCFATAVAMVIHTEQPKNFLKDISQLIGTGKLSRTFGGKEYSVPLSPSGGIGDLKRPIPLSIALSTLHESTGLEAAFSQAGLFTKKESAVEKAEKIKEWVLAEVKHPHINPEFEEVYVTIDQILKGHLLKHFNLTQEDLDEDKLAASRAIKTEIFVEQGGKKHLQCQAFEKAYQEAKSAFVSLTENALLKAWEFTLASFSETKAEFASWNLYASLGLNSDDQGGIGECLYVKINEKLQELNREVEEYQSKYEPVFAQVKSLEGRMKRANTEEEIKWIQAEYKLRVSEMEHYLHLRDKAHQEAQKVANLFPTLIEGYIEKFQDYFQEVYDPDMQDLQGEMYDDSPAGFRLLYKHGRSKTSLWTLIYSSKEYIEALVSFFTSTENDFAHRKEIKGLEQLLGHLITAVVLHVRSETFLLSALERMARVHGGRLVENPLQHLEKVDKKPWVYVSGGTPKTLLSCYYSRTEPASEQAKWVENVQELYVFFYDTVRMMPAHQMQAYANNPHKGLIAFSPTHLFRIMPGMPSFKKYWQHSGYPYTWIRDQYLLPTRHWLSLRSLDLEKQEFLLSGLLEKAPEHWQASLKRLFVFLPGSNTPFEFRRSLAEGLNYPLASGIGGSLGVKLKGEHVLSLEEVDGFLYDSLPLLTRPEALEEGERVLKELELPSEVLEKAIRYFRENLPDGFCPSSRFRSLLLNSLIFSLNTLTTAINYREKILKICQEKKLTMPEPIIIGDTNWPKDYFGFVVNPGTGELEFWRLTELGEKGRPMSHWRKWINGTKKGRWGIYFKPEEYSASS